MFKAIVMEKMDLSLSDYLRSKAEHRLTEDETRKFMRQIVKGLAYVHEKGYTHR